MILNLLFYLLFFLFSFGQLARISFFGQQINLYIYEIFLFLITMILCFKYRFSPISYFYKRFKIVFIFFAFSLITFLVNLHSFNSLENFVSFLYLLRLIIYFLYFFYLSYYLEKRQQSGKTFLKSLFIFIILTIIISVLQYLLYPDLRNLLYSGWDPHLYRVFGTFFDTSVAGGLYGLIFLFLFLKGKYFIKNKLILNSLLFVFLMLIVITFSRSLYITFLITFVWHAVVKRWYKGFLIFIGIFLFLLIIVPKPFGEGVNLSRFFSVESRIEDYRTAIKIWLKKPIIGIGYNRIRYAKRQLNISEEVGWDVTHSGASFHSSFLIILVTGGIVGLGLFFGILYQFFRLNRITAYYLVFLGLLSLADNIFLHPFILFLFLSLTSISLVIPSRK